LTINIYENFKEAAREREYQFPSLEAVAGGFTGNPSFNGQKVFFVRRPRVHVREVRIFNSELVYSGPP
jgi:hypothetical protein